MFQDPPYIKDVYGNISIKGALGLPRASDGAYDKHDA